MESRTRACLEIVIACSLAKIGEQQSIPALSVWPGPHASRSLFVSDLLHQARTFDVLLAFVFWLHIPLRIDKVYCLHTDIILPLKNYPLLHIFYDSSLFRISITMPPFKLIHTPSDNDYPIYVDDLVMLTIFFPRIWQAQSTLARFFSHQFG